MVPYTALASIANVAPTSARWHVRESKQLVPLIIQVVSATVRMILARAVMKMIGVATFPIHLQMLMLLTIVAVQVS